MNAVLVEMYGMHCHAQQNEQHNILEILIFNETQAHKDRFREENWELSQDVEGSGPDNILYLVTW